MIYLGDFTQNATIDFTWNSNDSNGASITLATNGTVSVYKGNSTTQVTTGVTFTEDFDGLTGVHHVRIVTTDAFYATGNNYSVVLSGATIDGQTVNAVIAQFSIQNRYMRGTDGANTTTPLSAAQVNSEVDTALVDYGGPTYAQMTAQFSGLNDLDSTAVQSAAAAALTAYDAPTKAELDAAQASIEADIAALNNPTAAAIADAVLDEALAGHVTAGTLGKAIADIEVDTNELQTDDIPGLIAALNNISASDVWTHVTRTLTSSGSGGATAEEVWTYMSRTLTASTNFNDPTAAAIADAIMDEAMADHATAGSLGKAIADILGDTNELQADDIPALIAALNNLSAAEVNAEVDAALANYDAPTKAELDAAQTSIELNIAGLNNLSAAQVNAEVDSALADYDAPTKAELDTAQASIEGNIAALNDPTAAAIADAVLDEALAGHATAGTLGKAISDILADTNELQGDDIPGLIAALNDITAADVWAHSTRVLTAATNLNIPTAADNADAVWDEQKAGHVAAGSFGEDVQAHALTTDIPTAANNADAVWDEQKAGHNAAGSFGEDVQAHALTTEVTALNDIAAADVVTALQTMVVDGSVTWIESLRIWLAFMAGESSGGGTTNPIFYGQDGTTARISATVTAAGNRTAVTLDGSA